MRRFVLMLLLVLAAGCSPKLQPVVKTEIRTEYRDRMVHDTVTVEMPPKMEESTVTVERHSHLENEWASSDASVDSLGLLHHSLETLPHRIMIPVTVPVHDTLRLEAETITLTKYMEKPLKWHQKTLMWLGAALMAAMLAKVIFKLIK